MKVMNTKFIFGLQKNWQSQLWYIFKEKKTSWTLLNCSKAQWKEGVQIPGQISELPRDFYPKLRRFLKDSKEQATITQQAEKFQECDRVKQLSRDIVNSRLKKIVSLSSTPGRSEQVLKKLTKEEKLIYEQLMKIISEWKKKILENGVEK